MAWRLDEAVEHGMIDNTVEGQTTGKIWLIGREEPLILSLNGDCWRDLAGSVLEFENQNPKAVAEVAELDTEQTGIIGDVTASRKARIPEISEEEMNECDLLGRDIPFCWRNVLYIEWFSEINGRVLIEAAGYELKISGKDWEMDVDQEEAQKLANLSAMRDFLAQVICRAEQDGTAPKRKSGELDEYEWEERLKESDRLTDAYQEVLEKYIEDSDSEKKEAFVMGWDGLLGEMAEREEGSSEFDEDNEDDEDMDDLSSEDWKSCGEDGIDDSEEDWLDSSHPLQAQAHKLALRAFDVVGADGEQDCPAQQIVSNLMLVSAKLAGVLHGSGSGCELEAGFVLAVLKRCLGWINESVGAYGELIAEANDPVKRAALENLRADTFSIRDGIIELRRDLKRS